MSDLITVGEGVVRLLEAAGVEIAFGVISIHNMPILDAIGRRNRIRFVPSRGEAGGTNMADAAARVTGGLGVVITSTGTAAGNACGAQVEAQTAGTPLLHLTGQIDSPHLDKNRAFIHEARDQLGMLTAVSKAAFRVTSAETAMETVRHAIRLALSAPSGPVSVEIPIDIQKARISADDPECPPVDVPLPDEAALDALAEKLLTARRPLLWLGGGARHAGEAVRRLIDLGFGVVTSTQGRGIVPEDDPATLGAFNAVPTSEEFYKTCDAMVVVGSRLRGNETLGYRLVLPQPLFQIDAGPESDGRCYGSDLFIHGDSALTLSGLADRLDGNMDIDPALRDDLIAARRAGEAATRKNLAPYDTLFDGLADAGGDEYLWVRDITLSNSMWGNRMMTLRGPRDGVHATGGGIGQGLPMAIGAALAAPDRQVLCLTGDGGLQLCIGELATLAESGARVLVLVMNDQGYGVIRNIQDAHYDGRHGYTDVLTPKFAELCAAVGVAHRRISDLGEAGAVLAGALALNGPVMVEVDMPAIGDFATSFAGPPVRTKAI
ncbi:MAG: thiamine pyrophosphate-binding protein [Rhodospirillaceae bacterium]|nr:thiamine pyrophosphate-binding protein [Rhodospirillaceae bacterium]